MLKWRNGDPVTRLDVAKVIFLMIVIRGTLEIFFHLHKTSALW